MTQKVLQIRELITQSNLPDYVKNEILPLLGILDFPELKEKILQILDNQKQAQDVTDKILATYNQVPIAQNPVVPPQIPIKPMPVSIPIPVVQAPVQTVPTPAIIFGGSVATVANNVPVAPQPNDNSEELKQLEDQMKQLKQK